MEFQATVEAIKLLSEVSSPLLIIVFVLYTLYFKNKDQNVINAEKLGVLQSNQLSTLIQQNSKLAEELHSVRKELSEAYEIINDMRNRVRELEFSIGIKEPTKFSVVKQV